MDIQQSNIEEVLDALRAGKPVLVTDAEDRENEGDAIIAAEFATPLCGNLDFGQCWTILL